MTKPKAERPLTPKQERFVEEYLTNGRSAAAAYRAAYNAASMKPKQVHEEACKLLANPKVAQRVKVATASAREAADQVVEVKSTDVLLSAKRAMLADLAQALDKDGNTLPLQKWPDDLRLALDSVQFETRIDDDTGTVTRVTKVKLSPRAVARDQLAKHLGLYERDNAQKRPHEAMTDEQLRAAIADELAAAGLAAPAVPGERGEDQELPAKPGGFH